MAMKTKLAQSPHVTITMVKVIHNIQALSDWNITVICCTHNWVLGQKFVNSLYSCLTSSCIRQ